jgi:ribose transport system substrate-binding protein
MKDGRTPLGMTPTRRGALKGAAVIGVGLAAPAGFSRRGFAADKPTLVTSIRSLSNPYHAAWSKGSETYAKAMGLDLVTLVTEGDSEKGLADIRAILAKTGGNMVLNLDPNDSADARPIVEACAAAKVYVMSQWNKPADLHPWDHNPYYTSFVTFDGERYGAETAEALIKSMGGKGGIVALGGILSNTVAIARKAGLDKVIAAHPDVKLLDFQVADWQSTKAYDVVAAWLTRFGDGITGVWAANDDMGVGALEALRAEGLAGKVPVTGIDGIKSAVDGVKSGEFAATVSSDPYWQGSMGLAIPYQASLGKFDPAKEPPEHREFYGKAIVVTKDNVDEFIKTNIAAEPVIDYTDLWGRVTGQVRPG